MTEKNSTEPSFDKGCVVFGILGSIFFMAPILSWWGGIIQNLYEWLRRVIGF